MASKVFEFAEKGDAVKLQEAIANDPDDVNRENPNNSNSLPKGSAQPVVPVWCPECYEPVLRKDVTKSKPKRTASCNWLKHRRNLIVPSAINYSCRNYETCGWDLCCVCYKLAYHDISAEHQMHLLRCGLTPLCAASKKGHLECVKILLTAGANLDINDKSMTPMMLAVCAGHYEVARELIEAGAKVNTQESQGLTALFMASENGDLKTVQLLLERGGDPTITDKEGNSCLFAAASVGHVAIMKLLISKGLKATAENKAGDQALHWLSRSASAAAVRVLVENGADVNAVNSLGHTPLLLCGKRGCVGAVKVLLDAGADRMASIRGWGTVLEASTNEPATVELMLKEGVAPNNKALIKAATKGKSEARGPTSRLLVMYGAERFACEAIFLACKLERFNVVVSIISGLRNNVSGRSLNDILEGQWDSGGARQDLFEALLLALKCGCYPAGREILALVADTSCKEKNFLYANDKNRAKLSSACASEKLKQLIETFYQGRDIGAFEKEHGVEEEKHVQSNQEKLMDELKKGSKEWGRSKIMIVGDGRAGKTALANSIVGEKFIHTESTVGINQISCDVKFAAVGASAANGAWGECDKPAKELEMSLARILAEKLKLSFSGANVESAEDEGEKDEVADGNGKSPKKLRKVVRDAAKTKSTGSGSDGKSVSNNATDAAVDEEGAVVVPAGEFDNMLVMQYLANMKQEDTKFVISIFDYGGQDVFNVIHHLFLTRYGVYTLVFNMEDMISSDEAVRDRCVATISFWLNSVIVHTWDEKSGVMAPIVLVGTHKDKVSKASHHEQISENLEKLFGGNIAWPFIAENEKENLSFFPVDNTLSRDDPTVVNMLGVIEGLIDKSSYVHEKHPLTWLKAMDKLTGTQQPYLRLKEVERIAGECDVAAEDVPRLLSFLNMMGSLMWHEDEQLRDIVVLDPIKFFVTPATLVICKHLGKGLDKTRHVVDSHRVCRKKYYTDFMRMIHKGIVNMNILFTLLSESGHAQIPIIVHLLVKFGLVVPLQLADHMSSTKAGTKTVSVGLKGVQELAQDPSLASQEYLVPALLPTMGDPDAEPSDESSAGIDRAILDSSYEHSFVLLFSTVAMSDSSFVSQEQCTSRGFLPRGLFERLLCKAVEWCRETSTVSNFDRQPIFQDCAVLLFGNQRFRMRIHQHLNAMSIDVVSGNPLAILQRLSEQVQQILDECMHNLFFQPALPYPMSPLPATTSAASSALRLITLDGARHALRNNTGCVDEKGKLTLTTVEEKKAYEPFLKDDVLRAEYDVFISYRWNKFDSAMVAKLKDRYTLYNVGTDNHAMHVFLDTVHLADGRNFIDDFARSLINSLVVTPIVSASALERMLGHDPASKDNVLLEWIIALESFNSTSSRMSRILPVLIGSRGAATDGGVGGNLFTEGILEKLPETVPTETISAAVALLRKYGVEPRPQVFEITVRAIVKEVIKFLCICTWTFGGADGAEEVNIIPEVTDKVHKATQAAIHEDASRLSSGEDVVGVTAPAKTAPVAAAETAGSGADVPKRTIKMVIQQIRTEIGVEDGMPMAAVLAAALEFIGDEDLVAECAELKGMAKAEKILTNLV